MSVNTQQANNYLNNNGAAPQYQMQMFQQPSEGLGVADRQKKYNTIDTSNMQPNMASQPIGSPGISAGPGPTGGLIHGVGTQETAGTTNPSAEVNANSEFIDIMRKVPRILCERYELLDVLGKGAHGRIYLAVDLVTHDRVAIKLVSSYFYFISLDGEIE